MFESSSKSPNLEDPQAINLSDYGLFLLVINPLELFSENSQAIIKKLSDIDDACIILVGDLSEVSELDRPKCKKNIAGTRDWIQQSYPNLSISSILLDLGALSNNTGKLKPSLKNEYDNFFKLIQTYSKQASSRLQISHEKQVREKLESQLQRLEKYLADQEETLCSRLQKIEDKLDGYTCEEWEWKKRESLSEVQDDRELFYEQVRRKIDDSFSSITSDNRPESLSRQLKEFINNFNLLITKDGNEVRLELKTNNSFSTHNEVLRFCKDRLNEWAEKQWNSVLYEYAGGGFNGLKKRTCLNLKLPSSLNVDSLFDQIYSVPNFHQSLEKVFLEMEETSYSYVTGSANNNFAQPLLEVGMAGFMAFLNPGMAVLQGVRVASNLIGRLLDNSEMIQQEEKLKHYNNQLRNHTHNHYRNVSRTIAEELRRDIFDALAEANRQFRKALSAADGEFIFYIREIDKSNRLYEQRINVVRQGQKELKEIQSSLI